MHVIPAQAGIQGADTSREPAQSDSPLENPSEIGMILEIDNLTVSFATEAGSVNAVERVSLVLNRGKTLGIVGESGCGKSVTALSIMRLLPKPSGKVRSGRILFDGTDLLQLPAEKMRKIRGRRIAMIFQEPMTALNPVHTVGKQIGEMYRRHYAAWDGFDISKAVAEGLHKVGISDPDRRATEYPHQLSGGMRQRVTIAMALACRPDILIADEPTTALDVTVQAQILKLLKDLQAEAGTAVLFITHDLGVIAEMCDEVAVMYAGRVVERAALIDLFKFPRHPYTQGLLLSIPHLNGKPKTKLYAIPGMVPDLLHFPQGCRFWNRCPHSTARCRTESPATESVGSGHEVSCFHWRRINR